MAIKDDINIPLVLSIGVLSIALLIVTIVATEALYYRTEHKIVFDRYDQMPATAEVRALAEQKASLERNTRTEGDVILPSLADAKQIVIQSNGKPTLVKPAASNQ